MKILKDKVAVVTGAASGIGQSLAKQLSAAGTKLMLVDWDADGLKKVHDHIESLGGQVAAYQLDVSKREDIETMCQQTIDHFGHVDILINNAGVAIGGQTTLEKATYEQLEWIFGVNFWGVVYGTKAFLPHLLSRSEAHIVNISSIFGIIGVATNLPYCSTKFAVRGFTESLIQELWNTNVGVTCVHPGGIDTNIVKNADGFGNDQKEHDQAIKNFSKAAKTSPDKAAQQIIKAIQKNKRKLLIGNDAKLLDIIARLFPSTYHSRVLKFIQRTEV